MNREHTLFHLREAADELAQLIGEVESSDAPDDGEIFPAIQHLYHHLNTAWNARNETPERTEACSEADFRRWRRFPRDVEPSD